MIGRLIAVFMVMAGPALAVDIDTAETCLADGGGASCIEAALVDCSSVAPETPAVAVLCYTEAREDWGTALTDRLAAIDAEASDVQAAVARTEARFDILAGLVQCDRAEALSLLATEVPGPTIAREKAYCQAMVNGIAFARTAERLAALRGSSL